LVQEGYLTLEALKDALALQVIKGGELDTILLERKLLDEPTLLALLSRATSYPPMVPALLAALRPGEAPIALEAAVRLGICPLLDDAGAVPILVSVTADPVALEELAFELDRRLSPFVAPDVRLAQARALVYGEPLPDRAARLLERLGDAPLPADLGSSGVLELLPLTPTIEPRRSSPAIEAGATPDPSETDPEGPDGELPLQTDPASYTVLGPLEPSGPAPELEPPAIPQDITDEFPPLRPRGHRVTEPLGVAGLVRPAGPTPSEPPAAELPSEPTPPAAVEPEPEPAPPATVETAPEPAEPAPPATEVAEPAPAEPTLAEPELLAEDLPPVPLGEPVPDMPPIPEEDLESSGEREVMVAPEALVPEEDAASRQSFGADEPTPPDGEARFGLDEVTPDGPPPSVVLGISSPPSSRPELRGVEPVPERSLEALARQALIEPRPRTQEIPQIAEEEPPQVAKEEPPQVTEEAPAQAAAEEPPRAEEAPLDREAERESQQEEARLPLAYEADPDATPLALHDAVRTMHQAPTRDDLLLALGRGIHSLLECVQIYVLRPGHLQGHLELTAGRADQTDVRRRKISLEVPSVISRAVEDGALFIGPAPDTDASGATLIAAGILALRGLVLLPIHLRGKTICLVAGHDYDNPISQRLRVPLMELADEAARSLAGLILRQKLSKAGMAPAPLEAGAPPSPAPEPAPEPPPSSPDPEAGSPAALEPPPVAGHPDLPPAPAVPLEPAAVAQEPAASAPAAIVERQRAVPGVISGEIEISSRTRPPSGEQTPRVVVEMPPAGFPFDVVKPVAPSGEMREHETLRMPIAPRPTRPATGPIRPAHDTLDPLLATLEEGGLVGEAALEEITGMGTPAIRELISRFPGRLRFDRFAPRTGLPPVAECSAVLRALCAFGRGVLLHIPPLFHHPDAEVRFYATYLMSELVYPEGVALVATRLGDPDPETRRIAAQILRRFKEMEQFPGVLLDLRSDLTNPDSRPRRAAIEALAALADGASVWVLADLLEDPDFGVREAALNGLVSLTKQDFGPSARRWQTWWERNEHRHRIEWLIDGLVHKAPEIRASAAADLLEITGLSFGFSFDMPRREREAVRRKFVDWWAETGQESFAGRA
jgi:hypothetical protein